MRNTPRFGSPPRPLRRARLDNVALVPGNLLSIKTQWQELANRLPQRAILIVLPRSHSIQKDTLLKAAKLLAQDGHQIRVIPEDEIDR